MKTPNKFDLVVEQVLNNGKPKTKKIDQKITMYAYEDGEIIGQEELSVREMKNPKIMRQAFIKHFGDEFDEDTEIDFSVLGDEIMVEVSQEQYFCNKRFE